MLSNANAAFAFESGERVQDATRQSRLWFGDIQLRMGGVENSSLNNRIVEALLGDCEEQARRSQHVAAGA